MRIGFLPDTLEGVVVVEGAHRSFALHIQVDDKVDSNAQDHVEPAQCRPRIGDGPLAEALHALDLRYVRHAVRHVAHGLADRGKEVALRELHGVAVIVELLKK